MIIAENRFQKDNCVAFGNCQVNKNYMVMTGDEHFYHFAGKVSGVSFLDLVHPDFLKEFKHSFEHIKLDESIRHIMLLKNNLNEYYWVDIVFTNKGITLAKEETVSLTMFFLSACESRYLLDLDNLNKYRQLLSLYQNYLFDYDSSSRIFSIYLYNGNQSTSLVKYDIDELRKLMLNHLETEKEITDFDNFYSHIIDSKKAFDCSVTLPIDKNFTKLCKFKANSTVFYTEAKYAIITGILFHNDDEEEEVIPYYATKEALDSATGLLNKRASMEYTQHILTTDPDQKHYMIVFDVDNFKSINDNYGHFFGDEVLTKVSTIISRNLNGRGICGRFGGDEFYILTNSIEKEEQLRILLTTMRRELLYSYEGVVENLNVTLSIGVSLFPNDGSTYDELFKKADKCLYLAKNKGRNRFIIYDEEKHGSIENEGIRSHKVLNLSEHAEYMANYISDAALSIQTEGKSSINTIIENISRLMEFDGVRIYLDDTPEPLFVYGTYKNLPDMTGLLTDPALLKKYTSNNVCAVGNISYAEGWHKHFFEVMTASNIMATTSFFFDINGKRIFFFYDVFNHKSRWNDSDKNYTLIISKLIANVLI